jgi:hypothetical protein
MEIIITSYSDKALKVTGDTKQIKDQLKTIYGRFNPYLQGGAGWIVPKKREQELRQLIASMTSQQTNDAMTAAIVSEIMEQAPVILNELPQPTLDPDLPEPTPEPKVMGGAKSKQTKAKAFKLLDIFRIIPVSKSNHYVYFDGSKLSYFGSTTGKRVDYDGVVEVKYSNTSLLSTDNKVVVIGYEHIKDHGLPLRFNDFGDGSGTAVLADGCTIHCGVLSKSEMPQAYKPEKIKDFEDVPTEIYLQTTAALPNVSKFIAHAATDEIRPVMNGVYFDTNGKVAATDAHRLIHCNSFSSHIAKSNGVIMTAAAVKLMEYSMVNVKALKALKKGMSDRICYADFRDIGVILGKRVCIDGRYVNYECVIPSMETMTSNVTFNRKQMIDLLSKISKVSPVNMVQLSYSEGQIKLYACNIDTNAEMELFIDAKKEGSEAFKIAFNGLFLSEVLKFNNDATATIYMSEPERGALIDDNGLLMPVMMGK